MKYVPMITMKSVQDIEFARARSDYLGFGPVFFDNGKLTIFGVIMAVGILCSIILSAVLYPLRRKK